MATGTWLQFSPGFETLSTTSTSAGAFTLRRAQILLASAAGQSPALIARSLGCTAHSVRNAIHAFTAQGTADFGRNLDFKFLSLSDSAAPRSGRLSDSPSYRLTGDLSEPEITRLTRRP